MKKTGNYKIPFDKKGNQLHYDDPWESANGGTMVDNYEFDDVLAYSTYRRGRSAAYFEFKRSNGRTVVMFLTDFEDVVPLMAKGNVAGRWTFCKRGQNYGVRLAKMSSSKELTG